MDNLEKLFEPYLQKPRFLEVLEVVKQNSEGDIWLMSSYLYRNLARELYGEIPEYETDYDFIVEYRKEPLHVPEGWTIKKNSYGVEQPVKDDFSVSITDIRYTVRQENSIRMTIDDFIDGAPLDIQCMYYDINNRKIVGDKGIDALHRQMITINNEDEVEKYAHYKGTDVRTLLRKKAEELRFGVREKAEDK